jgi:hypothetical protein
VLTALQVPMPGLLKEVFLIICIFFFKHIMKEIRKNAVYVVNLHVGIIIDKSVSPGNLR